MHLVITGLNAWNLAFLAAAAATPYLAGGGWHATVGLLAVLVSLMTHSAVFALFIGAAKTLKEAVRAHGLPGDLITRTSAIYFRLFPWALSASLATAAAAVLGGAAPSRGWRWGHGLAALAACALNLAAVVPEHVQLRRMHLLLAEMSRALPGGAVPGGEGQALSGAQPAAADAAPGARPPAGPAERRARGKAILVLCALGLVTLLGYRGISGGGPGDWPALVLGVLLVAGMGLGIYGMARGRDAASR